MVIREVSVGGYKEIKPELLREQLRAAGIGGWIEHSIDRSARTFRFVFDDADAGRFDDLVALFIAHDAAQPSQVEREAEIRQELIGGIMARIEADPDLTAFMAINQADALAWVDATVTDLASIRAVLVLYGKLLILLRDAVAAEIVAELRGAQ